MSDGKYSSHNNTNKGNVGKSTGATIPPKTIPSTNGSGNRGR